MSPVKKVKTVKKVSSPKKVKNVKTVKKIKKPIIEKVEKVEKIEEVANITNNESVVIETPVENVDTIEQVDVHPTQEFDVENEKSTEQGVNASEGIKLVGLAHLIGNIISGGLLGTVFAVIYLLFKNEITIEERQVCYDIINFNLSYIIYFAVAFFLCFVLIGFLLVPFVFISWIILLVVGGLTHLKGERYKYPFIITILQ